MGYVGLPLAREAIRHATSMNVGAGEIASVPDPYAAAAPADVCGLVQSQSAYDVDALAATGRRLLDPRGVVPPSARVESP